jgi:hypothetical protein
VNHLCLGIVPVEADEVGAGCYSHYWVILT